jgi:hypothetical protein
MSEQKANLPYTTLILEAHKLISGFQKVKYWKLVVLTLNDNFVLDITADTLYRMDGGLNYNFAFLKAIKLRLSHKLRVFEKRRWGEYVDLTEDG